MIVHELVREQVIRCSLPETFAFFARARNLQEITPPWLNFRVVTPEPIEMRTGTVIDYRLRLNRLPLRWTAQIEDWQHERRFVDRQIHGPYRLWHHLHRFEPHSDGSLVRDHVHYTLPLGPLGELAHQLAVRAKLERIFDYRAAAAAELLEAGG